MADTSADLQRRLEAWERLARDLDKENDDLRRENEAFRKGLGAVRSVRVSGKVVIGSDATPPTERSPDAPDAPEMCCGGTCVRAVCQFHGPQGARP